MSSSKLLFVDTDDDDIDDDALFPFLDSLSAHGSNSNSTANNKRLKPIGGPSTRSKEAANSIVSISDKKVSLQSSSLKVIPSHREEISSHSPDSHDAKHISTLPSKGKSPLLENDLDAFLNADQNDRRMESDSKLAILKERLRKLEKQEKMYKYS